MAKYILLECNRLRGKNVYNNLDEDQDKFKNSWTNVVSTTGIVVNAGDTVELDQIIVNSKGATDAVIEMTGEETEEGFIDNKTRLEYSFYVNHNGANTARMPFVNHRIYRGQGTVLVPFTQGVGFNLRQGGVEGNASILQVLSRRSLGEMFFPPDSNNNTEFQTAQYYDLINNYYCGGNMLMRARTIQTGGGIANNPASGYKGGEICAAEALAGQGTVGTGLQVRIETTTTSGDIGGIVESWSVVDMGTGYEANGTPFSLQLNRIGGVAFAGTKHILEFHAYPEVDTFGQSGLEEFDGRRFFMLNQGYSGLSAGFPESIGIASTAAIDINSAKPTPEKRTRTIDFEVEAGFLTPDNLAGILTDQLHEPTLVNENTNKNAPFFDYANFQFFHDEPNRQDAAFRQVGKPVIVETPTYTPQTCNFYAQGIPSTSAQDGTVYPTKGSWGSARRIFYNNIAFEKPNRYIALKDIFYNFFYFRNDAMNENDIFTGNSGSDTQENIGDYGNIKTGNYGCRVVMLNNLAEAGNSNTASLRKNSLVLTNMLWTTGNLDRIQKGFRMIEEYLGDLSLDIDTTSDNYKKNLCINLDLGMYDDEFSAQTLLDADAQDPANIPNNQRTMFNTSLQATATGSCEKAVDTDWLAGATSACVANQNTLPLDASNDGQQLGSIWVKSRFQEGFQSLNPIPAGYTGDTLDLTDFYGASQAGGAFNTGVVGAEQKYFTGNTFVDPYTNRPKTAQDCINDARSRDIAVVAVFPQDNSAGKAGISDANLGADAQKPIIAFVNGMKLGQQATPFNYQNLGDANNEWKVDFFNANQYTQLGFDPSFTRNKAVCLINPKIGDKPPDTLENYLNYMYIGAVNPAFNFNSTFSRFEITGLNTPVVEGNGLITDIPELVEANPTPESQVFTVNRSHQVCPQKEKVGVFDTSGTAVRTVSQFKDANQKEGSILESQSGIAIESMTLFNKHGSATTLDPTTDINKYNNTLFDKMGFTLNQLFPDFGTDNAFFVNKFVFQERNPTYQQGITNIVKPFTTGSYISSAEIQPLSLNELGMPLFDLGGSGLKQASPAVENAPLTAFKLPTKLDYPYLCVYSSIPSQGTDTIYIGGEDGYSRLPCMGYMTRNNNEGDYFYNGEQTYEYTATKDFTITEIDTEIRLPDGTRPKLEPHSAVIYKITKSLNSLPPQGEQVQRRQKKKGR